MSKNVSIFSRLITWGEKKTHTDLRYLISGGSWLFFGQVVGVVVALLLAVGYAHFLSKETYGTYKYVLSIIGILSVFTLPGMETAAQRGISQGKEAVFWGGFKLRVMGGGIASLACLGIAFYYFTQGNTFLASIFFVSAPFLVGLEPLAHYNGLLIGKKLFRQTTQYAILLQALTSLTLIVTVFLTNDLFVLLLTYMITTVFLRGAFFLRTVRDHPLNSISDKESLAFGKHLSALGVLATVSSRLDAVLLFHFLGPVPLAIYSFAKAATDNIQGSFKLITTTLAFPKLAGLDKDILKQTLERKVLLAHVVTVPLAVGFIFVIPYAYQLLFPQYLESVIYAQAMIALLAFSPLRFISTAITAKATPKILYALGITGPILNTTFLLIAVPILGIWGIILALALQQFIMNCLNFYFFRRM